MFCAAKRREALQITLIIDIKREIRRCQIEGGAVLDSCFVQIRTHQQHFALYQFLRAGALTGTKLAPTREVTRVRSYIHRTLLQRREFENSNPGRVLCLRMFCAAKRREASQITLIIDIKERSDDVRSMVGLCWTAVSSRLGLISSTLPSTSF